MKTAFIIIGAIVALLFLALWVMGRQSQKGSPYGVQDGRLAPLNELPNAVSSEEGTAKRAAIAPLRAGSLSEVRKVIVALGGHITDEAPGYLAASFTSRTFKFVDDVEIRDAGAGVFHIRSASRVGYSDRGVNRARVEKIRATLAQ